MTRALWRVLPGPDWLRSVIMLLIAALTVYVCFELVFPWVARSIPVNEQTVGN